MLGLCLADTKRYFPILTHAGKLSDVVQFMASDGISAPKSSAIASFPRAHSRSQVPGDLPLELSRVAHRAGRRSFSQFFRSGFSFAMSQIEGIEAPSCVSWLLSNLMSPCDSRSTCRFQHGPSCSPTCSPPKSRSPAKLCPRNVRSHERGTGG